NEYEIPQLLAKETNLTVDDFSDFRIEAPGRPESHHFLGARYLERGFIGRRQVLRDIFKRIENKQGAVVLKGPGGIGKSTLTTRTTANLGRKGYDFIVIQGETTIEQILEAISKKAAALGVKDAEKVYAAKAEPKEKLAWYLDQFLLKQELVFILDNFEENQEKEKAGEFKRERLKKFLWYFRDSLKHQKTFLFFSTRYSLPGFDSPKFTGEIPEFSEVEFRKMLFNGDALKRLDEESVPVEAIEVHKVSLARPDRKKLANLSLLECVDLENKDLYYVHRLTALYLLQQMKAAERKRYHKKAAKYFAGLRDEEGK
ncbi:MAG: ATP-binding protein, partial [bacterium]|nr:ATP-binding protein [bacterium]